MRPSRDEYFLNLLWNVSQRGTCPRRQVACILVDAQGRAVGMGYNGTPRGFTHCIDQPCEGRDDPPGDSSRCAAVHAEMNAILNCTAPLDQIDTAYVSCEPCFQCAKMLVNLVGLHRIVCLGEYNDPLGRELIQASKVELLVSKVVDESEKV